MSAAPASINVGLHPTALYAKNGALFVTNTSSNTVSVIDTVRDKVVQTIATQPWPEASVGYEPNAVTLTGDGHLLVVMTHNTDFGDAFEREGESRAYFDAFAGPGYAFGINTLLYALTH